MRYKIVMLCVLAAVLGAAYLMQDSGPPHPIPNQSANDAILRSLKVQ